LSPKTLRERNTISSKKILLQALSSLALLGLKPLVGNSDEGTAAEDEKGESGKIYQDLTKGFYFFQPDGFTILKKTLPSPPVAEFQAEESLVTAISIDAGASLGVTRTNARRLLQDFQIEWYFAPLDKISDLGSPALLAELLILQRQGDFLKKQSPSEVVKAEFVGDDVLLFEFLTPLREEYFRKTIAKAIYKRGSLTAVWVSGLKSIFDDEKERVTLRRVIDTFSVV